MWNLVGVVCLMLVMCPNPIELTSSTESSPDGDNVPGVPFAGHSSASARNQRTEIDLNCPPADSPPSSEDLLRFRSRSPHAGSSFRVRCRSLSANQSMTEAGLTSCCGIFGKKGPKTLEGQDYGHAQAQLGHDGHYGNADSPRNSEGSTASTHEIGEYPMSELHSGNQPAGSPLHSEASYRGAPLPHSHSLPPQGNLGGSHGAMTLYQAGGGYGAQPSHQGGASYGAPPPHQGGGGYGAPPPHQGGGGYGAPPPHKGGGGYGAPPPQQGGGGYGAPPPHQGGGGYGAPPPHQGGGGYGAPPPHQGGSNYGALSSHQGGGYGPSHDLGGGHRAPQGQPGYPGQHGQVMSGGLNGNQGNPEYQGNHQYYGNGGSHSFPQSGGHGTISTWEASQNHNHSAPQIRDPGREAWKYLSETPYFQELDEKFKLP
ncbi:glycine-rich cell wall structural protein 1.8-like [Belonocnema kinseyi]|uniref:glycine-rich cell wall structural protein 1.8-like n=1 Tax=Belonocnema kinseyi TaxID=2817044 RepID=UPI00143D11A7|nr:glycine-rich cell wall structural protein 1.8-like [Belonocnema kinseyi]